MQHKVLKNYVKYITNKSKFHINLQASSCNDIKHEKIESNTWLHTGATKYNLSALGTYFECERIKCTYLDFA